MLFLFIAISFLSCFVSGSVILLDASPATVVDGLTGAAVLRCGLHDTAASASVIGRRDTASTPDNVNQVSSINIMQNNVDLASVIGHTAKVLVNATNIDVKGDITNAFGEKGFLEMTLHYPTPSQIGEYQCEITAVTSTGHGVIFKTSIEINSSQPTIKDLVGEMQNSRTKEKHQNDLINNLQQTVGVQQQTIIKQQQTINSLESRIMDLQPSNWSVASSGLQVRLLGGIIGMDAVWPNNYGAIQLRYHGRTGMMCDDEFDTNNNGAQVVCRMLGYRLGTYADGNLFLGSEGPQDITELYVLNDVACTGTEPDLLSCKHAAWRDPTRVVSACNFGELAGVRCSS